MRKSLLRKSKFENHIFIFPIKLEIFHFWIFKASGYRFLFKRCIWYNSYIFKKINLEKILFFVILTFLYDYLQKSYCGVFSNFSLMIVFYWVFYLLNKINSYNNSYIKHIKLLKNNELNIQWSRTIFSKFAKYYILVLLPFCLIISIHRCGFRFTWLHTYLCGKMYHASQMAD